MSSTKKTIQLNKHIIIILLETKTVKIIKFKTLIMLRGNESPGGPSRATRRCASPVPRLSLDAARGSHRAPSLDTIYTRI